MKNRKSFFASLNHNPSFVWIERFSYKFLAMPIGRLVEVVASVFRRQDGSCLKILLGVCIAVLVSGEMQELWAQEVIQERSEALQLSSKKWESLGFSPNGKFFGSMTYGVEHDLASQKSHFFARLQVLHLKGKSGELVFERLLRRSLPMRIGRSTRAIMQDLLRRESRELRGFQIESLEQGDILLAVVQNPSGGMESVSQEILEGPRPIENLALTDAMVGLKADAEALGTAADMMLKKQSSNDFDLAIEELAKIQNKHAAVVQQMGDLPDYLNQIYVSVKNTNTTIFQLQRLRLDSAKSLRGQLLVVQSKGFPHRYVLQQNWASLLHNTLRNDRDLSIEPAFIAVSPDAMHLLLTLRIYGSPEVQEIVPEQDAESLASIENLAKLQNILYQNLERDENYAYVTFAIQVF